MKEHDYSSRTKREFSTVSISFVLLDRKTSCCGQYFLERCFLTLISSYTILLQSLCCCLELFTRCRCFSFQTIFKSMTDYGLCNQKHIFFLKKVKLKKNLKMNLGLRQNTLKRRRKKRGGGNDLDYFLCWLKVCHHQSKSKFHYDALF